MTLEEQHHFYVPSKAISKTAQQNSAIKMVHEGFEGTAYVHMHSVDAVCTPFGGCQKTQLTEPDGDVILVDVAED